MNNGQASLKNLGRISHLYDETNGSGRYAGAKNTDIASSVAQESHLLYNNLAEPLPMSFKL